MIIIKNEKSISILKNLEFMENTENSWKTRILSSFLYTVFTHTVLHGDDRLNMIEEIKLDCFFVIRSFQAVSNNHQKYKKTDFWWKVT